MKKSIALAIIVLGYCFAGREIHAQAAQRGNWSMDGNGPSRSGVQTAETTLSATAIQPNFGLLWKLKLTSPSNITGWVSDPLLAPHLMNSHGFKDFVFWATDNSLYAVDSELGTLLWESKFPPDNGSKPCVSSRLGMAMEPPAVINFNARRPPAEPAAGARAVPLVPLAPPPTPPSPTPDQRRIGVSSGGGNFGLKGIYVLTNDGMLHEQIVTTGKEFAAPVRYVPGSGIQIGSLEIFGKTVYATTAKTCGARPDTLSAIDMTSSTYPMATFGGDSADKMTVSAPAIAADGTAFVITGGEASAANPQESSIVALDKDLKVKGWYSLAGKGSARGIAPVTFAYKGRQLVAALGENGTLVLLDGANLGGADHHTALAVSDSVVKTGTNETWSGLAAWEDKDGVAWIFASSSAPISSKLSSKDVKSGSSGGGVIAFRVNDSGDAPTLVPVWVSQEMTNPAPPRVANGVVIALDGGNASKHATLFVLNGNTGEQLYSSKDLIPTSTNLSGLSIGDGHVFLADREGTLYSFGIGIEH